MDIETIYRLYFRDVCLFLQGLTRSETLAEELTQETFFRALDGLKDYDGKQDVRAWLFTVARNAYYDHCRRAKHAAPLEDAETKAADTPDIAQLLVDKDAAFTVHQCLHALEEPYKEVFSLRVFGELPFDRIGAIFGHNAAWARVTYYRAKTRIQTMLEQDAYCNDVLIQSAAVNAAMNAFNRELLASHIRGCVVRDIRAGQDEVIDELVATLQKLMK